MVHHALLIHPENNIAIYARSTIFEENDEMDFVYEATDEAFNLAKKSEIKGGIIFLDDAPTLNSAKAIISSQLSKVVYKLPPENPNELAALQLLEQHNIPAVYNPEIIVTKQHAQV